MSLLFWKCPGHFERDVKRFFAVVPSLFVITWAGMAFSIEPHLIRDICLEGDSNPDGFTICDDIVFFSASGANGRELWRTDATDGGTFEVYDIKRDGSSNPEWLTDVEGTLFFAANDGSHGTELWKTDGDFLWHKTGKGHPRRKTRIRSI